MNQKPEILFHCRQCGRSNFLRKAAHKTLDVAANHKCKGDFVDQSATPCFTCNFKVNLGCPDPGVAKHSPWQGCGAWFRQPASTALVPAVAAIPAKAPSLNDGHDQSTAKELLKRFKDAQTGLRRVVAFGLLAWEVKNKLKHGQFGPWLAAHCSKLATVDSASGKAKPSSALSCHMNLTKNVLDSIGFTVEKYLAHVSNSQSLGICHNGKYLLLPDKKLTPEALELKGKICNLVDGKTAKQLFFEFKQAEEDKDGNVRTKVGRLKGQGGASKLQRETKQQLDEKARLDAMQIRRAEVTEWLQEVSDDKHLGLLPPDQKFLNALDTAAGYLRRLAKKGIPET